MKIGIEYDPLRPVRRFIIELKNSDMDSLTVVYGEYRKEIEQLLTSTRMSDILKVLLTIALEHEKYVTLSGEKNDKTH